MSALRSASQERTGIAAALLVFAVCAVISCIVWYPLSLPVRGINAILPDVGCSGSTPGTFQMYLCSAGVGLLTLAGPVLLIVLIFLLRKPLTKAAGRLTLKLPEGVRFLVAPVLATTIFVLAWAGFHHTVTFQVGLLPQIIFPVVIGLFTFAVARYGPSVQRALGPFFDFRDRFPRWLRLVAAIAVPIVISMAITYQERVTQADLKEQFVVLVALVTVYLATAPRGGGLPSAVRHGDTMAAPKAMGQRGGILSLVWNKKGSAMGRVGLSVGVAALLGTLLHLLQDLSLMGVALADDCSFPADCQETSGYSGATATGGGAIGAVAGGIGSSLAGSSGTTILGVDGKPLPRWSPGCPAGEDGYEGKPGDVLVEGKWEDPEYARARVEELRRHKEKLERTWQEVQRDAVKRLHGRHLELEAEAAAERQLRQNAAETLERIKGYAKRRGYDDILERAEEVAVNPDGSVNVDYTNRLRDVLRNRIGLDIAAPGGKPSTTDWLKDGLAMTSKEIFTATDADGNTSYSALVLRGLISAASGGAAETFFTPMDALYRMRDGVDRGESGLTLFGKAAAGAIVDEAIGRAIGGVVGKGTDYLGKKFPGLTKTVSEYADDIYKKLNKPLGGVKPAKLTARLAAKKAAMKAALDSGDDDAIRALYKKGGMDDLAKLESGGHITSAEAKRLNKVLSDTTDEAIDNATTKTISRFKDETGVKVDETLLGDSGSSSRRLGSRSVKTDADRTLVNRFNDADVAKYAKDNNITLQDAYDDLSKKFSNMHQNNVDECLKSSGLNANDVDYKSYDRIGAGAGQADSYPEGFTNARQAQGRTTVYQADGDGNYMRSYET